MTSRPHRRVTLREALTERSRRLAARQAEREAAGGDPA